MSFIFHPPHVFTNSIGHMKHRISVLLVVTLVVSCTQTGESPDQSELFTSEATTRAVWDSYGEPIDDQNAVSISAVVDDFVLGEQKSFKVSGTLVQVCQSKGCWTTLATDDGRIVKMTFANYGFFLPTDAAGRALIAEGVGFKKISTVEEQRHFLEDAGATPEEIAAITEEKVEYAFEAMGVLLN
jgi:hypothetical protein